MKTEPIIALGLLFAGLCSWAQSTLQPVAVTGPNSNRVNVVFLAEGYTSAQLNQFLADSTNLFNAILGISPFKEYGKALNAYAIPVASLEPGSDHPAYGIARNTYFNSAYDAYSDYLITIPPDSQGLGKVTALIQSLIPDCDLPVVLVNDATSGGSDGFGTVALVSVGAAIENSADRLAHEGAHVLAGLGDEYDNPYPGFPDAEEPNTTRETRRDYIKWRAWIATNTPLPTPPTGAFAETVGLFEGAHYHATGWFRPRLDCAMRSVFVPFCEVCREALVLSFYGRIRPVETWSPGVTNLSVSSPQPLSFSVDVLDLIPQTIGIQWLTNGVEVDGATNAAFSLGASLVTGCRTVSVRVRDSSAWVRTDPSQSLTQSISWSLLQLHLDSLRRLPDNRLTFQVVGNTAAGVAVQTSTNFLNWVSVYTNATPGAQSWWFTNSSPASSKAVFRAVSPPR